MYKNFVVFDLETTGFNFEQEDIIEIGAVKYANNKKIESFSEFIKPTKPVPEFIKQLTHITDEQLNQASPLPVVLEKFLHFIDNNLLVCHNTDFDIGFLKAKMEKTSFPPFTNRFLDTLELSRIYLPFAANHKLTTLCKYFKIELKNAHRAIYDAQATADLFMKLQTTIREDIPLNLNNQVLQIARVAAPSTDLLAFLEDITRQQQKTALLKKNKPKKFLSGRNYIKNEPEQFTEYTISEVFGKNGVFYENFENYELRSGQLKMADAVLSSFLNDEFLLVEAGTGVGKSLAYLVPALIHTNQNQCKVIISTNTKNLQEQLFYKDLPLVKKLLNLPFEAVLLKGRRNYLCIKKWNEIVLDPERKLTSYEAEIMLNLLVWQYYTLTGDISENSSFSLKRNNALWKRLSADQHFCNKRKCQFYNKCYLMNIRQKAEKAHLVIINHHLLLADLQSENAALGEYDYLIVDEAHNMPHMAPIELGIALGYADIINFLNQIYTIRNKFQSGALVTLKAAANKSRFNNEKKSKLLASISQFIDEINDIKSYFSSYFLKIDKLVQQKGSHGKLRVNSDEEFPELNKELEKIITIWEDFSRKFNAMLELFGNIEEKLFVDYQQNADNLRAINQRIAEFYNTLAYFFNPDWENNAIWLSNFQTNDAKYPAGIINSAPLNIDDILYTKLYKKLKAAIFTSATMAIRGKFKYYASRMGLDKLEYRNDLVVESPFDYKKQAMVLVAGFLPDPKDKYFSDQSLEIIKNSVNITQKGVMTLFTSYRDLNNAHEHLSKEFYSKDILLLTQGKGMGRSAMLQEFRENKKAVLFGTNSFWEGVDIPGEALSLLILYKLPFQVPSEPVIEAYLQKLEAEGKNSFMHFMMPNALLKYRQGFGRLIRNKTDSGIVLVLDSRIRSKSYGQYFKKIIPARTKIYETNIEIYDFLANWFKKL
ncbi:MAG: ATP-dependent helicase DinG [Candidatus Cloacimonadota bacterium]|nr:ATP-dependent helicase DinG [Candidatus Cloacimonadota bacterium]